MKTTTVVGRVLAGVLAGAGLLACYARAEVGAGDECRNAEVRGRRDVDVCITKCIDEACRTRCHEQERWSHEHNCWVD